MKKLMILGASVLQLPAILAARDMGLAVVAVDMNPDAVGMSAADVALCISTIDEDAVLAAAIEQRIDGIMTLASDMPMRSVARVAQALGLPGPDMDTAFRATNKRAMRDALRDAGAPIPAFYSAHNESEFEAATHQMRGSYIVKPADNSGSRGVTLVERESDARAAYERAMAFARTGEILVEEYMIGREVSVEAVSIAGEPHIIAITDKLTTGAPYFVEMGHAQPSSLSESDQRDIRRAAAAAIRAIGIQDGPSHTELIVTPEGAKIVELGARLGGDCITTHLVPLSTGVDIVRATIRIALGEPPDIRQTQHKSAAIRYLAPAPGRIAAIEGLDAARALPGVCELSITEPVGGIARPIRGSTDRIGFVVAQSDTAEAAVAICAHALQLITVHTEGASE